MMKHYDKCFLKVSIPQVEYKVIRYDDGRPAAVSKGLAFKKDESGRSLQGGVVFERYFDAFQFVYVPSKFHGPERNYRMKEEFMAETGGS